MGSGQDKQAVIKWDDYRSQLINSTPVPKENYDEKQKRIKALEADFEQWCKFYFPLYCYAEPAKFQKVAAQRVLKNPTWYEVRAWSREMAKDARLMMEFMYLSLTGKLKCICFFSFSYDQAEKLLMPYMINLESNQRIINDYGKQKGMRNWETGAFVTTKKVAWYAFGAGQNPQGTRNEEVRPDGLIFSDIDTDEVCRNPVRLKNLWNWIEDTVLPMVSVSKQKRIVFLNNILAKDCVITRAAKVADHFEIINIRDKNGKSQWPEKNSEEQINWLLNKMSYNAAQKAYFNNPIMEGTTFKEIKWDKVPPLNQFKFLVAYGDPAPSNRENKTGSYKAVTLVGMKDGIYYIITCFLAQCQNVEFVQWFYDLEDYVGGKAMIYNYIENNKLQDPFYTQVYVPLFLTMGKEKRRYVVTLADERKKPDKFVRIEGSLEPINRQGRLIFNIAEKNNPHMMRLEDQFKAVEPTLATHVDGPDSVEGAKFIIDQKFASMFPATIGHRNPTRNNKRY